MKQTRVTTWAIALLALTSLASAQGMSDTASAGYKKEKKKAAILLAEPALPSLTSLKALSINQRGAMADLLWLKSIQYFGQGNPYGQYPSLGAVVNTITELDPKFSYAYEFGMVVLPFMGQTPIAVTMGERAQTAIPNDGLLTFYLASVYHLNVKDYKKAGALYDKASREPGAPLASRELAGVALASVDDSLSDRLAAQAFWKAVFENAKDESEKERAARWYAHLEVVYDLEQFAEQYKQDKGAYPQNLEELKNAGYIAAVPESPIGRFLILNPETGRIDFSKSRSGF
ncbi:MAG TPA: hypothetical protein VLA04_02490 [Verrucomicrobiae bacterium]|nr:hypothetical protein [Verrucomicrobiae bacterium]